MGRKPLPRDERWPCGSGEKYKRCRFLKGITYQVDDETGEVVRSVPLNAEARNELERAVAVQREKFIAKFGREPGPDDPSFFDLGEDTLREDTADAMRAAGIAPALIYAYEETGLIGTQENRSLSQTSSCASSTRRFASTTISARASVEQDTNAFPPRRFRQWCTAPLLERSPDLLHRRKEAHLHRTTRQQGPERTRDRGITSHGIELSMRDTVAFGSRTAPGICHKA